MSMIFSALKKFITGSKFLHYDHIYVIFKQAGMQRIKSNYNKSKPPTYIFIGSYTVYYEIIQTLLRCLAIQTLPLLVYGAYNNLSQIITIQLLFTVKIRFCDYLGVIVWKNRIKNEISLENFKSRIRTSKPIFLSKIRSLCIFIYLPLTISSLFRVINISKPTN